MGQTNDALLFVYNVMRKRDCGDTYRRYPTTPKPFCPLGGGLVTNEKIRRDTLAVAK